MRELEIKSLSSPDVDVDVWTPVGGAAVCFLLDVEIGEKDDDSGDLFSLVVATPEGLRRLQRAGSETVSDRAMLVLASFSWPTLHRELQRIVESCKAEEWVASVQKLQRYFRWEYEDYDR